ncbi:heat shock factor protein-like isoform X1 [Asterias amurensis]|uniref:heat shock factor protein-like isoform X1 n=1 Tax=Asterias amurensis TaxID=7602 RepID=UPI003AB38CDE
MAVQDVKGSIVLPGSSVPGFLSKLWLLVDDAENDELIGWSQNGSSFIVQDQTRFAKEILPNYFKHNNMASFIRQLNMYGFRKKANLEHGTLKAEKDDIEFQHPNFKRGKVGQLELIKRKVSAREESKLRIDNVHRILNDVQDMKGKQDNISGTLEGIQRENQVLWREVVHLRQRHEKQQKIVNRLIQFLITMVKPVGLKRKQQLMLEPAPEESKSKYSKYAPYSEAHQLVSQQPLQSTYDTDLDNLPGLSDSEPILADVTELPVEAFQACPSNDGDNNSAVPAELDASTGQLDPSLFELEISADSTDDVNAPIVTSPGSMVPSNLPLSPDLELSPGSYSSSSTMAPFGVGGADHQIVSTKGNSFGLDAEPIPSMGDLSSRTNSYPNSKSLVKRMPSHDEQRHEIGEHVTTVQDNLDMIQNLLTSIGPSDGYSLDMDSLLGIFSSDNSGSTTEPDLFPPPNDTLLFNPDSNTTGTELVQYVSPDDDDDDSLLQSLNEDSDALEKLSAVYDHSVD